MTTHYINQNDYLERNGYFAEDITLDQFNKGKELWRKWYRKHNKRKQRSTIKEVSVRLSKDQFQVLDQAAQEHNRRLSTYLREAALAYSSNQYLQPQKELYISIKQLLTIIEISIRRTMDSIEESNGLSITTLAEIQTTIGELTNYVNKTLHKPSLLLDSITDAIHTNPEYRKELIAFIESIELC